MIETICRKCGARYQVGTDHKCAKPALKIPPLPGATLKERAIAKSSEVILNEMQDKKAKFDKTAYQKAYMVEWRKKQAAKKKAKADAV